MEIINYIYILWRRKWIVLSTVAITTIVAILGTRLQTPVYQASATIRIAASTVGYMEWYEYQYITPLMNTYADIANSDIVLDELYTRLEGNWPLSITTELVPETELIAITVEDSDPEAAATAANTLAEILVSQSNTLYTGGSKSLRDVLGEYLAQLQIEINQARQEYGQLLLATPEAPDQLFLTEQRLQEMQNIYEDILLGYEKSRIREETNINMVTIADFADIPQSPVKPEPIINYGLGLVAGLAGGIILAFIFENLDPAFYRVQDIKSAFKAPLLGKLPKSRKSQLNVFQANNTLLSESFRRLVTNIHQQDLPLSRKKLLVTSPDPRQGKSMVALNLAVSLAEYGEKVILIDCNLRSPNQHDLLGLSNESGLKEVLEGNLDYQKAIQEFAEGKVSVITSGQESENPYKHLISPGMKKLIASLTKQFDRIVFDTPALSTAADAFALAQEVDGIILVVRQSRANQKAIQESNELMEKISHKFIGLIINEA